MVKLVSRANAWRLIVFVGLLWSLIIMAYMSAIPFFVLRYLFLPKDNFRIPIDFVSKNVSNPSVTAVQEQLVSLSELKSLDNMSSDNYRIDLELTMPRCDINRKKGPFTIKGALSNYAFTHNIHTLLNSKDVEARKAAKNKNGVDIVERMAMLPYKSDAVETIQRYMLMPLLVSDFKREESVIKVTLWQKAYRPKAKRPHLLITLPKEVWVSEAHITFTVKVKGLKYYLKEYPISAFFIVSFFSFIGEVCSFAVIVGFFYLKMTSPSSAENANRYVTSFTPSETEQKSSTGNRVSIITADGTKVYRERNTSFSMPSPKLKATTTQSQPSTPNASVSRRRTLHSPIKKRPYSVPNTEIGENGEIDMGGHLGVLAEINDARNAQTKANTGNEDIKNNENEENGDFTDSFFAGFSEDENDNDNDNGNTGNTGNTGNIDNTGNTGNQSGNQSDSESVIQPDSDSVNKPGNQSVNETGNETGNESNENESNESDNESDNELDINGTISSTISQNDTNATDLSSSLLSESNELTQSSAFDDYEPKKQDDNNDNDNDNVGLLTPRDPD